MHCKKIEYYNNQINVYIIIKYYLYILSKMERYYACLICITEGSWDCGNIVCSKCRFKHTIKHQHCMKEYFLDKTKNICDMCNGSITYINKNEQPQNQENQKILICCQNK